MNALVEQLSKLVRTERVITILHESRQQTAQVELDEIRYIQVEVNTAPFNSSRGSTM